jgi:hypothetical protein
MWRAVGGYLSPLYACVSQISHELRLTTASGVCPRGESKISWNAVGPRGARGPQGAIGLAGPAGPAGAGGTSG